MLVQQPWLQIGSLALYRPTPHLLRMPDPITRLNAALEGRYAIERELGEGGMATVYLADDLKHERKVALKVLKPELAAVVGAERFLAEIKTTANLTHPHILPLHDSGEADGFLFYVMPHIEGESLRERIDREKQLPVDEAVKIATDLAEALDYAHRHKVIHRDIKPANILIHEGRPLIADFGIALALRASGAGERLTETGLSLGTPHYMSPEQATGDQAVGGATDIYALGAVLYEMLVGDPPYTGSTAQAILGKIIAGKVASATEERTSVPANVDAAIKKALEKLPADRFVTAEELSRALNDPGFRDRGRDQAQQENAEASRMITAPITAAAIVVALGLGWALGWTPGRETNETRGTVRFTLPVPGGYENTVSNEVPSLAVSPDGSVVVYRENGMLMRRNLSEEAAEPIPGSAGAEAPFFSPDGAWLGFLQANSFRRMPLDGVPTAIGTARIDWVHGVDWGGDDAIVYGRNRLGIWRMRDGEQPAPITAPEEYPDEEGHVWPQSLGGGSLLLFSALGPSGKWHDAEVVLKDLETGERTTVVTGGAYARYVPSGHIVYATAEGVIQALPFDIDTKESGLAVPVESGVYLGQYAAGAMFAVSNSGTLVFVRGDNSRLHRLQWYDFSGQRLGQLGPAMTVAWGLEMDPTGQQVAVTLPTNRNDDIHVLEDDMVSPRRLSSDPTGDGWPVWSPDGTRIAWARDTETTRTISVREVNGDAQPAVVYETDSGGIWPRSWSPDGRWLVASERNPGTGMDIIAVDMVNTGDVMTIFDSQSEEWDPQFSPDGGYLAFESTEGGSYQAKVTAFPPSGDLIAVSTGEARHPRWSRITNEIYFWNRTTLMAARYRTEPRFDVESERVLFSVPDYVISDDPYYNVAPDGSAFLIQVHNPDAAIHQIHVVLNWLDEVRRRTGN